MIIPRELIEDAKQRMGDNAAVIIAHDLGFEQFDERNFRALCYWHKENTPSLVWNQKDKYYHCFGCSRKYDIIDHYMDFYNLTFIGAMERLFEETGIEFKFGEKHVKTKREYRYPYREDGDKTKVYEYYALRKISKETLDYCDVGADEQGNAVFHYYDTNDVLTTVKYRPSRKLKKGETKMWCQKHADTTQLLFNMNRINPSQPLLICEGESDVMAAIESGYKNVVSVPFGAGTEGWIEECWDWLEQFEKIIIWSDNDTEGAKMKKSIMPRLGQWRCYDVDPPTTVEIDGELKRVKDINEVLYFYGKEKVLSVITDAKETPITNVIDLADIQDFDWENSEGLYSGFDEFDGWIHKFFFGCLCVITGINSSGKSVLVNQMCIAEPLNQGYDVFVFAEELAKPQLKSWIEWNFAGRKNIRMIDGQFKKIKPGIKELITDWYKGKVTFYDNDADYTATAILAKMEELARRRGVKVFVIDNLMKVDLECSSDNIWQRQKEFTIKLVNFANKYNALVFLVAHPRKTEMIRRLSKLDISGSGDITNLASYVMAIHRYTKEEKEKTDYDCVIDLFKNRITGTQDKSLDIYFDTISYRFWTDKGHLNRKYGWEKEGKQLEYDPF